MNATVLGMIIIPLAFFLIGGSVAVGKVIIWLARYFTRLEEGVNEIRNAGSRTATTLEQYVRRADERFENVEFEASLLRQDMTVVQTTLEVKPLPVRRRANKVKAEPA